MTTTKKPVEKKRLQPAEVFDAIAQVARPLLTLAEATDQQRGVEHVSDVGRFARRSQADLAALATDRSYATNELEARQLSAEAVLAAVHALTVVVENRKLLSDAGHPALLSDTDYFDAFIRLASQLADEYRPEAFEAWECGVMDRARLMPAVAP